MIYASTQTAMAELLLSGCTTSSDHLYIYPNGVKLDDCIHAAREIGMRFVATRGSMSVGQSKGGLPPDRVVEQEDAILKDTQRLITQFHDASHGAMTQVAVAPCSPFSVSQDLMRLSAEMARHYGVRLHTQLAENDHDIAYSLEKFNRTPTQYAEDLGWLGNDVWHAHCVKLDDEGISLFAATRTGIAHCPCSNMRLASGIAPIRKMIEAGVPVGLGVDGSASNDAAHMVNEARQAMLLARLRKSLESPQVTAEGQTVFGCDTAPMEMTARDALRLATRGGAEVLGRKDIGQLSVGYCADMAMFDLRSLSFAGGAVHDASKPPHGRASVHRPLGRGDAQRRAQLSHQQPDPVRVLRPQRDARCLVHLPSRGPEDGRQHYHRLRHGLPRSGRHDRPLWAELHRRFGDFGGRQPSVLGARG
jgi:cytosine/adenosine deaminase-related metal-dependent hydrolase